jgi:lipid-A-disaccharide synthase-like uncharacterized protein
VSVRGPLGGAARVLHPREQRPSFPRLFWLMSLSGSCLLLLYFIFGKNDSVGIMSNLFPAGIALYNLYLHGKHEAKQRGP